MSSGSSGEMVWIPVGRGGVRMAAAGHIGTDVRCTHDQAMAVRDEGRVDRMVCVVG